MAGITFDIEKELGAISQSAKGWKKELNLISWNEKTPKYDLRDWSPDHVKMGKGVTLTAEELKAMRDLSRLTGTKTPSLTQQ
ncbi:MAG: YdbC family protein [Bacillus sp. (in: firmicutes)]